MEREEVAAPGGAKTSDPDETPGEASLLIDVNQLAGLLRCSARHIWRLSDRGKMPRPCKIGALCRWDRAAVERWVAEGCPPVRKAARR